MLKIDQKCCPWCSKVAGRYTYGEEPDDIYRRHDNCDCTVTFENGRKRQDVWSKREWEAPKEGAGAGERRKQEYHDDLTVRQQHIMGEYLHILELRAEVAGIML